MAYIGLLDCNNFFVSCERLFRPDLTRKPVLVLSSNDGCVVARSKEVKELGIPMGVPYFQVKDELKKAQVEVFSSNIVLYRDISARVMSTLATFDMPFEQYSIDEAFFWLEGESNAIAEKIADMKDRVEAWTGIPVSIGVGKSMVLAKYASEIAKKGSGTKLVTPGPAWGKQMESIHVGELWGVGRKTTQKFLQNGIETAADVVRTDSATLRRVFGIEGVRLRAALCGVYGTEPELHESQKSIMSSRSFGKTTTSKQVLLDALSYHISHAAEKMRKDGMAALRMSVSIRPKRHGIYALRGGFREVVFDRPVVDTRTFIKEAKQVLEQLYEDGVEYAKAGVVLGGFVPEGDMTLSLFESGATREDGNVLMQVTDMLNTRFGGGTLRLGTLLGVRAWQSSSLYRSPSYTTSWKEIPGARCERQRK